MTSQQRDGAQPADPTASYVPPRADPGALGALIRQAVDPLQLMQRVVDQMVATIEPADGAVIGLITDSRQLRYVCGSGYLSGFVGEPMALDGSLSGAAIQARRTLLSDDTERDGRVDREAARAFDVRSTVCVPLGRGEQPIGVLSVSSTRAGAFDANDVELLSGLADFIATVLGAATDLTDVTARVCGESARDRIVAGVLVPDGAALLAARERIERILQTLEFAIVLQPIFDLERGEVSSLEALARFRGKEGLPPDAWLARAHDVGLGVELELALLRHALGLLPLLPPPISLSVNVGPQALESRAVREELLAADPKRIVLELTEHVPVEDYPALSALLAPLREAGVRLAIDDTGAGFASLMHVLRLDPDYIKLDRQLISGIDGDPVRRSLAGSLMRFAEETGTILIAEGVETAGELAALRQLGIGHAQGFHLARPAPPAEILRTGRRARGARSQQRGLSRSLARPASSPV